MMSFNINWDVPCKRDIPLVMGRVRRCQNAWETIPKRRIESIQCISKDDIAWLRKHVRYTGSAHHKKRPADFGFNPPTSPRPTKSLCDGSGSISKDRAQTLFRKAIDRAMISTYRIEDCPKYIWAVDEDGDNRVYEAKLSKNSKCYHGYELGNDEGAMRTLVIDAWNAR